MTSYSTARLMTIVLLALFGRFLASAQEAQVPIDREGKISVIDERLEKKLKLFPAYKNFREARMFQASDTAFILEISYQPDQTLLKVRRPMNAAGVDSLRAAITGLIESRAPEAGLNHEGQAKLLVGTSLLSLGYYGWGVPYAFDAGDGQMTVGLYMITSSLGFIVPFALTQNTDVTDGEGTLALYGLTRGVIHGVLLNNLLAGSSASPRSRVGFGMLASIGEGIGGYTLARSNTISGGTAEAICVMGDFGLGLGTEAAALTDMFDNGNDPEAAGVILAGSALGMASGAFLAGNQNYTRGDAYVLRATGFLGAYIPFAILNWIGTGDGKAYLAASMAGTLIGIGAGDYLVRGKDFTTGEGTLVELSEAAGCLMGLGLGLTISPDHADGTPLLTLSAIGATAGFLLMYNRISEEAGISTGSRSFDVAINPIGLLRPMLRMDKRPLFDGMMPALSMRWQF